MKCLRQKHFYYSTIETGLNTFQNRIPKIHLNWVNWELCQQSHEPHIIHNRGQMHHFKVLQMLTSAQIVLCDAEIFFPNVQSDQSTA